MIKKSFNPLLLGVVLLVLGVIIIFLAIQESDKNMPSTQVLCPENRSLNEACIKIYDPVCGHVQIECVTTPCNPIKETFGNSCEACSKERVLYYTEGVC